MLKFFIPLLFISTVSANGFEHYISRDKHRLMNGNQEFRFFGLHVPEMHRIENDAAGPCKYDLRGWGQHFQWPTSDEQENWIKALVKTGHKAVRVYVLSIEQEFDAACNRHTHINKPIKPNAMPLFNEDAMRVYDRMIALSNQYGLRLILPVIDHWKWWGGREQLAQFYGEDKNALYNAQSKTYKAYQHIIRGLLSRRNTITGRLYTEEKAIMAWETGNELLGTNKAFLTQTTALIKSLAPNQLVIDGTYTRVNEYAINDPNVDIISNHLYWHQSNQSNDQPKTILQDLKKINGKKAYFIGEFGLLPINKMKKLSSTIVDAQYNGAKTVGALVWSFRGHRHNGGFYWHNEGGKKYYSYHLPGFTEGDFNDELAIVNMARNAAAKMEGKSTPALPIPEPPILRAIKSNTNIQWMGSPVGREYIIERAGYQKGPWKIIGDKISDGKHKFDPKTDTLFSDNSPLKPAKTYYYRVKAVNETGVSKPSNIEPFTIPVK